MSSTWFEEPILAIESSCDETSAAVVVGRRVMSSIVSSQAELHRKWGGVVPEAAARAHVEAILPVIEEALLAADLGHVAIRAVAVTNRPGLVGALSVGVTAAKALAMAWSVPLIGIHHLEGHLLSPFAVLDAAGSALGTTRSGQSKISNRKSEIVFPHTSLIASGGHTELVLVKELGSYDIVGQTIDDAAGEAFDKSARVLGLGYPGGRAIQDAAVGGDPTRYSLPRGLPQDVLDFSFSGLKTAVLRLVEKEEARLNVADAAASVQEAIASVLAFRTVRAAEGFQARAVTLVGGVAANSRLRELLSIECDKAGITFFTPPLELCTDNAAMIGVAASFRLARGERNEWDMDTLSSAALPAE